MSNYQYNPAAPPVTSLRVRDSERIASLERGLRSMLSLFALEAPQRPALSAGWINYSPLFGSAHYWRDPFGVVRLEGLVKKTSALSLPETIFTLPAGYRPPVQRIFDVQSNAALGRVDVLSGGEVQVIAGSFEWVNLSGIAFTTIPDLLTKAGGARSARLASGVRA